MSFREIAGKLGVQGDPLKHPEFSPIRKFSTTDLHLIILALLEPSGSHGYELIRTLEEKTGGVYVPSPSMIYPGLYFLVGSGYAKVEKDGNRIRYFTSELGRAHLDQNQTRSSDLFEELSKLKDKALKQDCCALKENAVEHDLPTQSIAQRQNRQALFRFLREHLSKCDELDEYAVRTLTTAFQSLEAMSITATSTFNPDNILDLMQQRRSMGLSRLKPDPVDRKIIEQMLEAANWAPSHEDTEPWRFTVFTGQGREKLADLFAAAIQNDIANGRPMKGNDLEGVRKRAFAAPVWISIGMTPKTNEDGSLRMSEHEELMAVACAMQNLHLMAQAHGIAGLWHSKGTSVHQVVAQGLGLANPSRLLGFFMCGWPATEWLIGSRRPITEKVVWNEGKQIALKLTTNS